MPFLRKATANSAVRFVVSAGHIHNYERNARDGVMYLVSGGGGARPYEVDRAKQDLYQGTDFPNFHYVRFELQAGRLKGEMIRLEDYDAEKPRSGAAGTVSRLPCGLNCLNQLVHGRLGIAIQHARLIEPEQCVVDA